MEATSERRSLVAFARRRIDQKRRTRDALISAARRLVADGATPTVEAAAEAASISTTRQTTRRRARALLQSAVPDQHIDVNDRAASRLR